MVHFIEGIQFFIKTQEVKHSNGELIDMIDIFSISDLQVHEVAGSLCISEKCH